MLPDSPVHINWLAVLAVLGGYTGYAL